MSANGLARLFAGSALAAFLAVAAALPAAAQVPPPMPAHCRPPAAAPPAAPPAAAPPAPMARSLFETDWDWDAGKRALTFCVAAGTPVKIASAARFSASNLSNAGFGWTWTEVAPCVAGWNLANPVAGQQDVRVRAEDLGEVVTSDRDAEKVAPHDEQDDYRPTPGGSGGTRRPGGMLTPPLAYFQPGPLIPGRREIGSGEIVFNWRIPQGMNDDPKWSIDIGTSTYDPRITGMHEWGHAIRMRHDEHSFDDDRSLCPAGSRPGAAAPIVQRGLDNVLQTRVEPDDTRTAMGDLTAGADGVANSGKKANVMEALAVLGRHGINPGLGFPPNSAYSYTDREQATGIAARNHRPAALGGGGAGILAGGGQGQHQFWHSIVLFDPAGMPIPAAFGVQTGNGPENDLIVEVAPPAVRFEAFVNAWTEFEPAFGSLAIHGELGSPSGSALIHLVLPLSPEHPEIEIKAIAAADLLVITDRWSLEVLCTAQLTGFVPGHCLSASGAPFVAGGLLAVELDSEAAPPSKVVRTE